MVSVGENIEFIGKFNHTLDPKHRLIFPNKFREQFGESGTVTITKGFDHCLYAYELEGWTEFKEKIQSLPMENPESRLIMREFLGYAMQDSFDKQGRILITEDLRAHASLDKEVVLMGIGKRIEIWDREYFENSRQQLDMNELGVKLAERGISL